MKLNSKRTAPAPQPHGGNADDRPLASASDPNESRFSNQLIAKMDDVVILLEVHAARLRKSAETAKLAKLDLTADLEAKSSRLLQKAGDFAEVLRSLSAPFGRRSAKPTQNPGGRSSK